MSFANELSGGALLIMMGQNTRSESLFYYFRLEDHVPKDHLLRLVDRHIDFAFVREALKRGSWPLNQTGNEWLRWAFIEAVTPAVRSSAGDGVFLPKD